MSRIDDLYAKYFKRLVRSLGGTADAEDDVQEAMIARWRRPDEPENEAAYLATSARNNARRRVTRAATRRRGGGHVAQLDEKHDAPDTSASAEQDLIKRQEIARFRAAFKDVMSTFSSDTRQCLALRKRGLGSKEIAAHLGLTDQAVRTRLSRAMDTLRQRLSPPPGVEWLELLGDDDDHER